jgi:Ca-activated chloride channel family protein
MSTDSITNSLTWPWAIAIVLGAAMIAGLVVWLVSRRARSQQAGSSLPTIWVANSEYIRDLPAFKSQVRRYRLLQGLGAAFLTLALTATGFLVAKPVQITVKDPRLANRDIVLCLDVSGSMIGYDRALVDVFGQLAESFAGERIALSVFNSTSRLVFPLTDDYALVREQLEEAYVALDPGVLNNNPELIDNYLYFTAGANADLGDAGSSLIGDGLANCTLQFEDSAAGGAGDGDGAGSGAGSGDGDGAGSEAEERSRSIIFATDNDLRGTPVYSLKEAAKLATDRDISLIGLYGAGGGDLSTEQEYRKVFTEAGGMYFYSDDPAMVDSIVADIQSRQAVLHDAAPIITRTNTVGPWFAILVIGLLGFFVVQRRLGE